MFNCRKPPQFWGHYHEDTKALTKYWRTFIICFWLLLLCVPTRFALIMTTNYRGHFMYGYPKNSTLPWTALNKDGNAYNFLLNRADEWVNKRPITHLWFQEDTECLESAFSRTWAGTNPYNVTLTEKSIEQINNYALRYASKLDNGDGES